MTYNCRCPCCRSEIPRSDATALAMIKRGAAAGKADSLICLAGSYEYGELGLKVDLARAVKYYSAAADAGSARACLCLGNLYIAGKGVKRCRAAGARLFARAVGIGSVSALYSWGSCLWDGCGVERDRAEALRVFKLGSDRGEPQCTRQLARAHAHGHGPLTANRAEAVRYYRRAADAGDLTSRRVLANLYAEDIVDAAWAADAPGGL